MKEKRVVPAVTPSEGNGVRGGTSDATESDGETAWAAIAGARHTADANDNAARRNLEA